MKKLVFLPVAILLFTMQSCIIGGWDNGVRGEGEVIVESHDITGFTGIHASAGIDVVMTQGDYSVEVEADENLHEYIIVEKEGKMLHVGSERSIYKAKSKVVHISLPELTDVKISSAGDIDADGDFECEDLEINISSAGDLNMGVDADDIYLSISSSGDCDLWGKANSLDARLSSAGDLNAFDLEAKYVDVKVSSAGDASVNASKEIEMSASSAGNIYYTGDAKVVKSHTSSAGSIVKR